MRAVPLLLPKVGAGAGVAAREHLARGVHDHTASALSSLSETYGARTLAIERRQGALSTRLDALATALQEQTRQTTALVDAVNRLMREQTR